MRQIIATSILILFVIQGAYSLRCWQQICRECAKDSQEELREVECEFRNLVAINWLDKSRHNEQKNYDTQDPEFSCLRLEASSSNIVGNSMDYIRGCSLKSEASTMCASLKITSQSNNKEQVSCDVCEKDMCNGAVGQTATLSLSILTIFSILKYFYN